jgi:hypothetical protein
MMYDVRLLIESICLGETGEDDLRSFRRGRTVLVVHFEQRGMIYYHRQCVWCRTISLDQMHQMETQRFFASINDEGFRSYDARCLPACQYAALN